MLAASEGPDLKISWVPCSVLANTGAAGGCGGRTGTTKSADARSSILIVFVLRACSDVHKSTRSDYPGDVLEVRRPGRDVLVLCMWTHRSRISYFA